MNAYLFDLDGTLVDSRDDIAASANAARRAVGLVDRPAEEIWPFIGEGAQRLVERALGPENADRVEAAIAAWRAHYEAHMLDRTRVFAGIPDALSRLKGSRAVVTNKPGASARRLVETLGLSLLCPVVIGGGDTPARKPDPLPVRTALDRLGPVDGAVFIGDSGVDAQTARAAGLPFVGVLWGLRTRAEMEETGGRIFVGRPEELPEACRRALSGR